MRLENEYFGRLIFLTESENIPNGVANYVKYRYATKDVYVQCLRRNVHVAVSKIDEKALMEKHD